MKKSKTLERRRSRSAKSQPKPRKPSVQSLEALARGLVREELAIISRGKSVHKLPLTYAALALTGQSTNIQTAQLPQAERLERMFCQLDRAIAAFHVIRRQVTALADREFSSTPAFVKNKKTILNAALKHAFFSRNPYLVNGFQELCLVNDVLWPAVKRSIAARLSIDVEVDDCVYEAWMEQLGTRLQG